MRDAKPREGDPAQLPPPPKALPMGTLPPRGDVRVCHPDTHCPTCHVALVPEHTHAKCPRCGYRDSCCF